MSTVVFPFQPLHPEAGGNYEEGLEPLDDFGLSRGGRSAVIERADELTFRVRRAVLRLPDNLGNTVASFWAFLDARTGRVDTFLFKAHHAYSRQVQAESIGTAAGGGGETFTTAKKFLHHVDFGESEPTTLVVYVDAVEQVLTTDYTVSLNGTTPTITTTAAFDTGAVTASYEYYHSVRFAEPRFPTKQLTGKKGDVLGDEEAVEIVFQLVADRPGAHLA